MRPDNLFRSFFIGGFECADQVNRFGERINLLKITEHDIRIEEDYRLLSGLGIFTAREGICWSSVEKIPGVYDWSEVLQRMKTAEKFGIQVIWDLIHFGYPDGIFPTHPHFAERFENLCLSFCNFYKQHSAEPLFVVPCNEISFLSWFSGEARGTVPYAVHNGWDIKYHLCKAVLAGIRILKSEIPECKIVMVEPLIKIHNSGNDDADHLFRRNEYQFEAVDIIAGRMCPELGGREDYLEVLGFNYYWNCQWKGEEESIDWPTSGEERTPFNQLLLAAYKRYQKPVFISETGHFGEGRVPWLEEITAECLLAQANGVDFHGICIYPIIDRPDWDNLLHYHNSGIYDLDENQNRIPLQEYVESLEQQQKLVRESVIFESN